MLPISRMFHQIWDETPTSDKTSGGWQRRAKEICHARHDARLAARMPVAFLNYLQLILHTVSVLCITMDTRNKGIHTDLGEDYTDKSDYCENRCCFSLPASGKTQVKIDCIDDPGNQ